VTIRELLLEGSRVIAADGKSESAWLDACVLFADLSGFEHGQLLAAMRDDLSLLSFDAQTAIAEHFIIHCRRRATGYPIAYLRGKREFFGRDFQVTESVLIPRPETEILIEWILETVQRPPNNFRILDCCTGSGCIAVTLAAELQILIEATDLSQSALAIAHSNAIDHKVEPLVRFHQADLLEGLLFPAQSFDLICANPPYVPSQESRDALELGWNEPLMALDGGEDGLDLIRRLLPQAWALLKPGGALFMEYGDGQTAALLELMSMNKFVQTDVRSDLAGLDRIVRAFRPGYYVS